MVMTIHGKEIMLVLEIISLLLAYHVVVAVPAKFGYTGSIGPSNWGELSPDYSLCSTGTLQSPIDITDDEAKYDSSLENLKRDYVNSNATLINNGFNVELRFERDIGEVLIGGKNYSLLQLHWHSPAEHTINGKRYPMELHLVHKTLDGANIAVIAVLYDYGRSDPFVDQLKDSLDKLEAESRNGDHEAAETAAHGTGVVNTKALSRGTRKYYRYFGSLTAPPCTETVIWNILGKVKQMSPEQVAALKAPLRVDSRDNSRPLQPLNGRTVNLYHAAAL